MPIADVNMIAAAAPVFTVFFARLFLKVSNIAIAKLPYPLPGRVLHYPSCHQEKCHLLDGVNLLLTFAGIVLIIKPPFIFGTSEQYDKDPEYAYAAVAVLAGALLQANVYIMLRLLKGNTARCYLYCLS